MSDNGTEAFIDWGRRMDVIGAAPLALGALLALGGILMTLSYLSE
jgi:hypothetical protein